jgi:hypothetical protein
VDVRRKLNSDGSAPKADPSVPSKPFLVYKVTWGCKGKSHIFHLGFITAHHRFIVKRLRGTRRKVSQDHPPAGPVREALLSNVDLALILSMLILPSRLYS